MGIPADEIRLGYCRLPDESKAIFYTLDAGCAFIVRILDQHMDAPHSFRYKGHPLRGSDGRRLTFPQARQRSVKCAIHA